MFLYPIHAPSLPDLLEPWKYPSVDGMLIDFNNLSKSEFGETVIAECILGRAPSKI